MPITCPLISPRILFVRTDRMGDVLMNLPAIRLLRQTYPKSWIAVLVDEPVKDLLQGHSDIDEVFAVDADRMRRSFRYRWKLLRHIRRASFDLAVISNPDKFLHALMFLARIPHRIGYDRKWGFLLTRRMADRKAEGIRHEMDLNLELAGLASGGVWDGRLTLPIHEGSRERVEALLKEGADSPVLAVHPGTSNPAKRWAPERFAELCDRVQEKRRLSVVLVGGPEERAAGEAVVRRARRPILNWTGVLTLKELVAFLGHPRVKALVSSDSGPVHIAWMSGTPVVALYARNAPGSDPVRWGPRNGKSRVIYKPMSEITPSEVSSLVEEVLEESCRSQAR